MNQFALIAVGVTLFGAGAIFLASCFSFDLFAGRTVPTGPSTFRRIAITSAALTFGVVFCSMLVDLAIRPGGPEALGGTFAFLTAAAWLPVVFAGRQCDGKRPGLLYGLLLLLEAAFLGVFLADDAVVFCLSLESSTFLLALLIGGWGGSESEPVARKFLLYNLVADMLVLIAILGLVVTAARMSESAIGPGPHRELSYSLTALTHDVPHLASDEIGSQEYWRHARRWLLTALLFGLVIKTPLVPFHTWFAPAIAEGPLCTGLAMLGAGLRVSAYGCVRFVGPLCGELGGWGDLLVAMIVLGAAYQSLLTLAYGDVRKLAACASLSQTSLAIAGFFTQHLAGTIGCVVLAVGGGFASTLLFFCVGMLELRFDARDLSVLSGIWGRLPQMSCTLLLAVLSLVGVPALCGFPGLFAVLGALFAFEWVSAVLAMAAGLLLAWALFWMLERIVFDPQNSDSGLNRAEIAARIELGHVDGLTDLRPAELWLIAPLVAGIVFVGLQPQAVVDLIESSLRSGSLSP